MKAMFILGAVVDAAIAISWFLIASGMQIPNILNGYVGFGADYQLAMYVSGMFMMGWAVILAWGAFKPEERKGLLLITSAFLTLSLIIEVIVYGDMLGGTLFVVGAIKRIVLSLLFTGSYIKSFKKN
jgi:hypothetical protein